MDLNGFVTPVPIWMVSIAGFGGHEMKWIFITFISSGPLLEGARNNTFPAVALWVSVTTLRKSSVLYDVYMMLT